MSTQIIQGSKGLDSCVPITLGIVAGSGVLPSIIAQTITKRITTFASLEYKTSLAPNLATRVVAACHKLETGTELAELVASHAWVKAGQLGKIIKFFKSEGVTEVVFAGGIKRPNLLRGFWPDLTAINVMARAGSVQDDKLLREIAREFERNGMQVLAAHTVLPELLTPDNFKIGTLTAQQQIDARLGWRTAFALGELDVGQTAAVHRGMVIALEGIEGTDACIKRAADLCGPGFTVVKRAKPQQDERLDLPTIGDGTIDVLTAAKAGALIIHAGASLLLNPLEIERKARGAGLTIVAVRSEDDIIRMI